MKQVLLLLITFLFTNPVFSQEDKSKILAATDVEKLLILATESQANFEKMKALALQKANEEGWMIRQEFSDGTIIELMALAPNGDPIYYKTDNDEAAETISTDEVHSGGNLGLSLDGNGFTIGEWDGGKVRTTHQQYTGRVTIGDNSSTLSDHATHVCGTLIGDGTNKSGAKGMAPNADVDAYKWDSDDSEMATAAANGLLVSNHSYGTVTGWYTDSNGDYYWYGSSGDSEDDNFGRYANSALQWDAIAEAAPYYLIVKSAGNDRSDSSPSSGKSYTYGNGTVSNTSTDPHDDDCNDGSGYDCIPAKGNAKNILTVGAVKDINGGYSQASDVDMTSFSGWGPTDDGRIKPDICGNGYNLYSSTSGSDSQYSTYSGTSMSAPSVTGSLILLQEHYENVNGSGNFMRAATLKGLAIHTADEAGSYAGPDYEFGWGLMNTATAASLISSNGTGNDYIEEATLPNNGTFTKVVSPIGLFSLEVTISWTDPTDTYFTGVDNSSSALVNDLDVVITPMNSTGTYYPYVLDPANPSNAATTGDNYRDNVEKVVVPLPSNAIDYLITVTHKGTLVSDQDFSIIVSGIASSSGSAISGCRNTVSSYPYTQGFENGTDDWEQMVDEDFDWTVKTGSTASSSTGPSSAYEGSYYIYTEATGNVNNNSIIESPCFDLSSSGIDDYLLTFSNHMYGANMGTLTLEAKTSSGSWTSIWTQSGNQGNSWEQDSIYLTNYLDEVVQFRFTGTTGTSFKSDMAIDNIKLEEVIYPCHSFVSSFPYSEGFESGLGEWKQGTNDDFDWTQNTGSTGSSATGPSGAYEGSYYYYTEASSNFSDVANFVSPCFNLKGTDMQDAQVSFAYHMYGSNMGTLALEATTPYGTWTTLWTQSGNLGNNWFRDTVNLGAYVNDTLKLRFVGTTGTSYRSDMAIDDIMLEEAFSVYTCSQTINTFPHLEDFENGVGDWLQSSDDDFDWTNHSSSTATGSTGPSSALEGTYYMYAEANGNGSKETILESPCYTLGTGNDYQVSFGYHMYGSGMGDLELQINTETTNWTTVWSETGNQGNQWNQDTVNLGAYIGETIQLRFVAIRGSSNKSDIAIDQVLVEIAYDEITCTNTITALPYNEDFENGFTEWIQSSDDDADWTSKSGSTATSSTGPASAYSNSNYIYLEANGVSSNELATIESPCFYLYPNSSYQVSYAYHMYGSGMGDLELQINTDTSNWTTLWSETGNQGNQWNLDSINLDAYAGQSIQLRFIATRGSSNKSDIAIDHVIIEELYSYSQGEGCGLANQITGTGTYTSDGPATGNGCYNCSSISAHADWWYFTATNDGYIDISSCGKGVDTRMFVYQGHCQSLTQIANSDDDCTLSSTNSSTFASFIEGLAVTAGETYYIEWDDRWSNSSFDFDFRFYTCDDPSSLAETSITYDSVTVQWNAASYTSNYYVEWSDDGSTWNTATTSNNTYTINGLSPGTAYQWRVQTECGNVISSSWISDSFTTLSLPPMTYISETTTNVLCNGQATGSINAIFIGGVSPYSYSWNNNATTQNISNLTPGTYNCTITDAFGQTTTSANIIITEPTAIASTETVVNVTCNGLNNGSIDLTVSGGIAPYTYNWSNNATTEDINNLVAGTYTCTVTDANSCLYSSNAVSITQTIAISATNTVINTSCSGNNDGSINLTPAGGTAPYTYLWSNNTTSQNLSGLFLGTYTCIITDANGCTFTTNAITVSQPLGFSSSLTTQAVTCNGGSDGNVSFNISGGTAPYSYLWSNNATTQNLNGLSVGSYICTVTDANNCTFVTSSLSITEPTVLSLSNTSTDISCSYNSDGAINLTVSGGTAPYTYLWSNNSIAQNPTGLTAGAYTCTITDASGCTISTNAVTISSPVAPSFSTTITDASCNGDTNGTIDLNVLGGVAPFNYLWNNNANIQNLSGLSAGNFSCTVTDANGCSYSTNSITISEPAILSAVSTNTDISCFGQTDGSINLTPTGGTAPYTYLWNNLSTNQNLNNLDTGTYNCIITDTNGCLYSSANFTFNEPAELTISDTLITDPDGITNGSIDITPTGGTLPYTFSWSNGETTEDIQDILGGSYSLTITDANGCNDVFDFYVIGVSVHAIMEDDIKATVYPNPIQAQRSLVLNIQSSAVTEFEMVGFDALGKTILPLQAIQMNATNGQFFIKTPDYKGLLFLRLSHKGQLVKVFKIMIID